MKKKKIQARINGNFYLKNQISRIEKLLFVWDNIDPEMYLVKIILLRRLDASWLYKMVTSSALS